MGGRSGTGVLGRGLLNEEPLTTLEKYVREAYKIDTLREIFCDYFSVIDNRYSLSRDNERCREELERAIDLYFELKEGEIK